MCSSRTGASPLARCCSSAAGLQGFTGAVAAGRWFNPTAEQAGRDRSVAAAAVAVDYSSPCHSIPKMLSDFDKVIEPVWCDLWQESSILTHPEDTDWFEMVSPTCTIMPSPTSHFITKLIPEQMLITVSVPQFVNNQSRVDDYDGGTSSDTAEGFSCHSDNSTLEKDTTVEFANSSTVLDRTESFFLEESCTFSSSGIMQSDSTCGDNQDAGFLDYDWASMTDFDDLDGILSYSVLGDSAAEMTGGIFSSVDSTCSKLASHLVPEDTSLEVTGKNCSYLLQGSEECQGKARGESTKRSRFSLMEDKAKMDAEKGDHPFQLSSNDDLLRDMGDNEMKCTQLAMLSQQAQAGEESKAGQDDFAVPTLPQFHVAKKQRCQVPDGYDAVYPSDSKISSSMPSSEKMLSMMCTMTPLQKIGKLRCNQKIRATLAISEEQKKFGLQFSGADSDIPHTGLDILQGLVSSDPDWSTINSEGIAKNADLPDIKMLVADEGDDISVAGLSQAESTLHELQNTISKFDDNFRTCIRDSLFRLARCAIGRCNGYDSSTNTCSGADEEATLVVGMMMKRL